MPPVLLAAEAVIPANTATSNLPQTVPVSPDMLTLATLTVTLPSDSPPNNRVDLDTTVGIAATLNIPKVLFLIFRDGVLIFDSMQGLQNGAEQFYCIRMVTADFNVPAGSHTYELAVQRMAMNDPATVNGPIAFTALAFAPVPN